MLHIICIHRRLPSPPKQADFSRYSHVSACWQILYIPLIPLCFVFTSFIGIAATSAGVKLYGQVIWDPNKFILAWTQPPNVNSAGSTASVPNPAAARAAQFFTALSFALASLGTNISANSISAVNNLTAIAPRYFDLRRGQLFCAVVAWALVPWRILASVGKFLNFRSTYSVFFGLLAAIMLADYWIVKRRRYDVRELYVYGRTYHYSRGWNWRAVKAFVVGVAPTLPGLAQSVGSGINAGVGARQYAFGWLLVFLATLGTYVVLRRLWRDGKSEVLVAVGPDEVYEQ